MKSICCLVVLARYKQAVWYIYVLSLLLFSHAQFYFCCYIINMTVELILMLCCGPEDSRVVGS